MADEDDRELTWARAVRDELLSVGASKADLARFLGVAPQAVDNWLPVKDAPPKRRPPEPATVFAVEDFFEAPGRFAPILGYRRAELPDPSTLAELLHQDPALSRPAVAAILALRDTLAEERRGRRG
jgi:transcriptional regulator with XRE-family HTH domain